ncbi:MAG: formate dehydrogenase accessory sulfurtransferase FdhD [Candidatus Lokiarchaeota archaeon]|nr:formate dehydrogenase accessory sulfurtransferase FdhD [Candidatus Lokiarchaeota archaeon]
MFKRKVKIFKIKKDKKEEIEDIILYETPIDIYVNSEQIVNIICLVKDLKELSVGFLFSVGIINSISDIKEILVNEFENSVNVNLNDKIKFNIEQLEINPVSRVVDTTCGISTPWRNAIKKSLDNAKVKEDLKAKSKIKVKSSMIFTAIKKMQTSTPLYRETGGCHGAAIFDIEGNLLSVKEDIGRHNAIDKVIGDLLLIEHDFENVFLTSTGRLTGDSVLKAIRAKIPIVASLSAAIESGIRLAFAYGITLIGFARGSRMNIYTHPERIEI